jgi:hypothetical protein
MLTLGVLCLGAIGAVVMPYDWLVGAIGRFEPQTPVSVVVEFLARFVSLFYVLLGALLVVFSRDICRYATPIRLIAWWCVLSVGVFACFALPRVVSGRAAGLLLVLIAADALVGIACAAAILLLLRRALRPG